MMRAIFLFSLIDTAISKDWKERHGQVVEVLGLRAPERYEDVGRPMRIRFSDGYESFAWESELNPEV